MCRKGMRFCTDRCRALLWQIDRLLVAGGDLAAIQAELDPADFTVLSGCYNALRDMVISLDPKPAPPAGAPGRGAAAPRRDPAELTRDRTGDISKWPGTPDAAKSADKIMALLQGQCASLLSTTLTELDRLIVKAGGTTAVQTAMGAGDFTEFNTCFDDIRTVLLDIDPSATPPDFSRDRVAEISRHQFNHPAP
jgi:hypothetical protein